MSTIELVIGEGDTRLSRGWIILILALAGWGVAAIPFMIVWAVFRLV